MGDIELEKEEKESIPIRPKSETVSIKAAMEFQGNTGIIRAGENTLSMPRKPVMGTCGMMTLACAKDMPGINCFLHECALSRGYESCLECPHWNNPEDPCALQKVSRDFCPATSRLFSHSNHSI